jgi:hypothetical protein
VRDLWKYAWHLASLIGLQLTLGMMTTVSGVWCLARALVELEVSRREEDGEREEVE